MYHCKGNKVGTNSGLISLIILTVSCETPFSANLKAQTETTHSPTRYMEIQELNKPYFWPLSESNKFIPENMQYPTVKSELYEIP